MGKNKCKLITEIDKDIKTISASTYEELIVTQLNIKTEINNVKMRKGKIIGYSDETLILYLDFCFILCSQQLVHLHSLEKTKEDK